MLSGQPAVRTTAAGADQVMTIRVIAGEISAKDVTIRSLIPSSSQPRWPPLERVAETIATPRRRFPAHGHAGVEVLTYVTEGSGLYSYGEGPEEAVAPGSVQLLFASTNVAHAINPGKGQMLRWFSVVAALPATTTTANGLQSTYAREGALAADGTTTRFLVGPASAIRSAIGLEAYEVAFRSEGTSFRKIGHGFNSVVYAFSGAGSLDGHPIELGEAAIVEDAAGVALHGRPGFRTVLIKVPRPT